MLSILRMKQRRSSSRGAVNPTISNEASEMLCLCFMRRMLSMTTIYCILKS